MNSPSHDPLSNFLASILTYSYKETYIVLRNEGSPHMRKNMQCLCFWVLHMFACDSIGLHVQCSLIKRKWGGRHRERKKLLNTHTYTPKTHIHTHTWGEGGGDNNEKFTCFMTLEIKIMLRFDTYLWCTITHSMLILKWNNKITW